jgi:hypothetical protein
MVTVGSVVEPQAMPTDLEALVARLAALAADTVAAAAQLAAALVARGAPDADAALDPAQVAAELNVPLKQAQKLIAARAFPVERIGKRYVRVRKGDLLAYRAAQREGARPLAKGLHRVYSPLHDKHRPPAPPAPTQTDAGAARRRRRRPADDGRPLGAGTETDLAPRRHRPYAVRGAGEPLDPDEP